MTLTRRRRTFIAAALLLTAVVIAGALLLFKPWLLFVDVRVDDEIPDAAPPAAAAPATSSPSTPEAGPPAAEPTVSPAAPGAGPTPTDLPAPAPAGPVALSGGSFISHEHRTTGSARIIEQPDGTRVLALEDLETTTGPDVHVWLSAADVVEGRDGWYTAGSAEHVDLGMLKGNQGNQLYSIPDDLDLTRYKAVDLWCVQFSVSFGAAQLNPF
ncbi:DM13 domain-containing protein [uncultured Arthrobacter sp.]|uniref:DM13 domain-containing protein n=1 Tax=uncultured Arthrobacter sp. TaxID=114050 RepID=UPI0025D8C66C|nr:DM13 domain-containing protein [uncultured Arthrobacter sp.]